MEIITERFIYDVDNRNSCIVGIFVFLGSLGDFFFGYLGGVSSSSGDSLAVGATSLVGAASSLAVDATSSLEGFAVAADASRSGSSAFFF